MRLVAFLAALVLAAPGEASAWGFTAHRLSTQRAIAALSPGPWRELLQNNADWVAEHAIDPDLWRTAGLPGEGPAHYLDLDSFGEYPFRRIPLDEQEHRRLNGADASEKGRLPWRTSEAYRELVGALSAKHSEQALRAASTLAHYIGDAHVPLHAATNYDGQMTGQHGIHARWEETMVDRFLRSIRRSLPTVKPAEPGDPVAFTMKTLRDSFLAVAPMLSADRACAGPRPARPVATGAVAAGDDARYRGAYYSCLYRREGASLVSRLGATSSAIASFWQAAWVAAGRPSLDTRSRFPYVRGKSRAIVATLDGASGPLIEDAVRRGIMPQLAALRARGARSSQVRLSLPLKTAVGHATLYTGAWPADHGITGTDIVAQGSALDEPVSGFTSTELRAEPLWITAARQGLRVTVAQATQISPFEPYLSGRRFGGNYGRNLTLIDGFQTFDAPDEVIQGRSAACGNPGPWIAPPRHHGALRECRFAVARTMVFGLLYDDPTRATRGYDSLLLSTDRGASARAVLHAEPLAEDASAFGRLEINVPAGRAGAFFRLFELRADGSDFLLYRARVRTLLSSRPGGDAAALAATGGTVGNGAIDLYRKGALGPQLWQGGDGTAERRYLESVALAIRQSVGLLAYAAEKTPWDLLVTYLAFPDESLHLWLGRADPALRGHDPALAARLQRYLDRMLRLADALVGELVRHATPSTFIAIATDHGIAGADQTFRPNVALAGAGLLVTNAAGELELSKTRALYLANNGFVRLNRAGRPKGLVARGEEARVIERVISALRSARDDNDHPVVTRVMVPGRDLEPGIGGPSGGDVYFELRGGIAASGALSGRLVEKTAPHGDHLFGPDRPAMKGTLAIGGAGVAIGDLGPLRQIDVAPTLCHLLGLDPPTGAAGVLIEAALTRPPLRARASAVDPGPATRR